MASAAKRSFAYRHVDPGAVSVPVGFHVEVVAEGLTFPSGIEFDEEGNIFVAEMGSPDGSAYHPGRVLRVRPDGSTELVADGFSGSITGITRREGSFYIIEHAESSKIYWLAEDGSRQVILDGLPGGGDHPTSDIVVAHSERLYFGQGTRTNSAVVGLDNAEWVRKHPDFHDIPGRDVQLTGRNFVSQNILGEGTVWTGAFQPFGIGGYEGEAMPGYPKCTGSIMRMSPDGGEFELFTWGLRSPFGLSVHADGRIFCTDCGMENRGSRRVAGGGTYIWHISEGEWYGWPDFQGGLPVTNELFKPEDAPQPDFLMVDHPPVHGVPEVLLPRDSGLARMDFCRSPFFGSDNIAFVALTGSFESSIYETSGGYKIVTADITNGAVIDFATNRHVGPASVQHSGGLEHPIAVKFDRTGEMLYVLDLGIVEPAQDGRLTGVENTGVLWRIRPEEISI